MDARNVLLIMAACALNLSAGEIPEKAERYREMLLKRPENPVLFGRMLDAWLEERELDGLRPELEQRAKNGGAADWRLLAVLLQNSGDEAAALAALDEAVKLAPDDAAVRMARGKALGAALRFETALEDLESAAKDPATALEAGTLRGKLLARAGRPAEAVKAWQELIANNPEDEGLKEDLIELEIGEGMLEEAIEAARELAAGTGDPYKKALRRVRVAEILAQAGKRDEALKEYLEVFAVSADGSWLEREVLAKTAALFSREDDLEGLKTFLGELREAYPRRVAVKKEAAKSLLAGGEEEEAIAMFREVLKVLPGDREVREEFIALLESADRHKEAAEEIEALLAAAEDDAALWQRLAALRKAAGDEAGAGEAIIRAVENLPQDETGAVARARLWESFERLDEAEKTLRDAVAAHGPAGEAGEALAGFLVAREKDEEAVALWTTMAAGADREGLLRIARSLAAHGKASEAFAILRPRMEDFPGDPLLLAAICQAAQLGDDPEAGVPFALDLVRLAGSPTDLETALRQATALVSRSEDPRRWLEELAAEDAPTVQERCLLAELYESLGDSIAAENMLKEAIAGGDDRLLAATQRVRLLEMRGATEAAVAAMRELIALPGGAKTAHVKRLVDLLERAGDIDKALAETENWLRIAPGDKLAWSKRAQLFLSEGRSAEAVAELRRALAKFGQDEELRAKLAEAQRGSGMVEEAWRGYFALYDEAESTAAKMKWVGELASMAEVEGKEEELVGDFQRRSRDNPTSVVPLMALAEIFRGWQHPDEELKWLGEASRRKPDDGALKFRLADLEEQMGNDEAAAAILRGLSAGADAAEARRRLSAFWIRQGEVERGLRELAAAGNGADPRATEKLVMPLAVSKDWETVAEILARETAAQPDDWRLAYFYAVAMLEAGKEGEAFGRFVRLLEADGDLAGVLLPSHPGMRYAMAPQTAGGRPEISRKAIPMFRNLEHEVFSYRQDRNYYAGAPGEVRLPNSADEVRRMALLHAVTLARKSEENQESMLAMVTSSHFDDLAELKKVAVLNADELRDLLLSPDAMADMFLWYLQAEHRGQNSPDKEILQRGFEVASSTNPELALHLSMWRHGRGDSLLDAEIAADVLELYKKLDDAKQQSNFHVLQRLAFADEELPEELRMEAEKLFLARIEDLRRHPNSEWMLRSLPVQWLRVGRHQQAMAWIDKMHAEGKGQALGGNRQTAQIQRHMMHRGHGQASPLSYPEILSHLAPNLYQRPQDERVGFTDTHRKLLELIGEPASAYGARETSVDWQAAAEHADKLADLSAKIAIYENAGRKEDVERVLASVKDSPHAGCAELLIAATHDSSVGNAPEEAFALLARSREAPDAGPWRDLIDLALVEAGVALSDSAAEGVDLEPAKRAALRLRKQMAYDADQRSRHADTLVKLGLVEEGARFAAAALAAPAGRNLRANYGISRGSLQRGSMAQEINKLVSDGKRETAARRLLVHLRRISNSDNFEYESRQLFEIVASLKLDSEMIEASAPPEGTGFARRRDHALLLVRLDDVEGALPWLRTLASEKPEDAVVRTALYTALPEDEQKAELKALAAGDIDADALGNLFRQWIEADAAEKRLNGLEAMAVLLETLEPTFDGDRNLSWVNYLVKKVVTDDRGAARFSPMFKIVGNPETDEELSSRRTELAGRTFRAMLRHPQTAAQGFFLMHGARETLELAAEDLDRAAVAAMRASMKSVVRADRHGYYHGRMWAWIRGNGSSTSGGPPAGGMTPDFYIRRRGSEGVKLPLLDGEFLKELEALDDTSAASFARCQEVIAAPGDSGFIDWKKSFSERAAEAMREIIWIYQLAADAGRDDLREHVSRFLCEGLISQSSYPSEVVRILAAEVSRGEDMPERLAAMSTLAERILGPEEGWALYSELGNNYPIHPLAMRIQAFRALLYSFHGDTPAMVAGARFSVRHGLGPVTQVDWSSVVQDLAGPAPSAADLVASGILAAGPEPVADYPPSSGESMIASLIGRLKSSGDTEALVKDLLQVEGESRFWARIVGSILKDDPEPAYRELDRAAAEIAKWPAAAQADFTRFVTATLPGAADETGGTMKKLLEGSLKLEAAELAEKVATYLEEGLPLEMRMDRDALHPVIARLVADDPSSAAKLWVKGLESARDGRGGRSSSGGFYTGLETYAHERFLDHLLRRKTSLADVSNFLGELAKEEVAEGLGIPQGNMEYRLRSLFESDRSGDGGKVDPAVEKIGEHGGKFAGAILAELPRTADSGRPVFGSLVAYYYLASHSHQSTPVRDAMMPWVRRDLRKLDAEVADGLALALLAKDVANLDEDLKSELRSAYGNFIANPSIPAEYRAMVWMRLMNQSLAGLLDDECNKATADLLAAYITAKRAWAGAEIVTAVGIWADHAAPAAEHAGRVLEAVSSSRLDYSSSGGSEDPRALMGGLRFALARRTGDVAEMERSFRATAPAFRGKIDFVVKLWQAGLHEQAAASIARPGELHLGARWMFTDSKIANFDPPKFTRAIEEALPGWLESVTDPVQRYRAECIISSLDDAEGAEAPAVPLNERLKVLIGRFADEGPLARAARMEVLAALCNAPEEAHALESEFAKVLGDATLGTVISIRREGGAEAVNESYVVETLLRRSTRHAIEQRADLSIFFKQVESLAAHRTGDLKSSASSMLTNYFRWYAALATRKVAELPQAERPAITATARRICELMLGFGNDNCEFMAVSFAVAIHGAAGDGAAMDEWLASLPEDLRSAYDKSRGRNDLNKYLRALREWPLLGDRFSPGRIAVLTSFLNDPATIAREIKHPTDISKILDSELFSRDEIFEVIDALPEDHPQRAEFIAEKAAIIGWRTDESERALECYDLADAAAAAVGNRKSIDYVRAYRARYLLERLKKRDEAVAIAKELDLDNLTGQERGWMENLLKEEAGEP